MFFFGTPCRHAATLGVQKIDNMISKYQLKKSNETILIYATVLFCGRNFRAGVFVVCVFKETQYKKIKFDIVTLS